MTQQVGAYLSAREMVEVFQVGGERTGGSTRWRSSLRWGSRRQGRVDVLTNSAPHKCVRCESEVRSWRFWQVWNPPLRSPRPTKYWRSCVDKPSPSPFSPPTHTTHVQSYVMLVTESLSSFDLPIYMLHTCEILGIRHR